MAGDMIEASTIAFVALASGIKAAGFAANVFAFAEHGIASPPRLLRSRTTRRSKLKTLSESVPTLE